MGAWLGRIPLARANPAEDEEEDLDDSEERFTDHADEPYHVDGGEDDWLDGSYEES